MVEEHGVGPVFGGQPRNFVARDAVADDQPAPLRLQRLLQFRDAGMDELDPPVGPVGKRIQDFPVENEDAGHLPGAFERVMERGVIEVPQIAAKPDQCAGVFRHGA